MSSDRVFTWRLAVWLGTTVPPMLLAAEEVIEFRWSRGSRAVVLKTRADCPQQFQYPTTCCPGHTAVDCQEPTSRLMDSWLAALFTPAPLAARQRPERR